VPRIIDFEAFAEVAREVDAIFAADAAHIAGLIAGGVHPSPVPYADVVTTTTHKTLRGPRGAMFVSKEEHASVLDRAVFPGLQGGPHNHTTAAIAVALKEAAQPEFKEYARAVVENATALADDLVGRDFELVSGGTDNHLLLVDLTNKNVTGKIAAKALDRAGIELNYNTVPFDPRKPFDPSGIRLGTPSVTSRGMGISEMVRIGEWIDQIVTSPNDEELGARIKHEIAELFRESSEPVGILGAATVLIIVGVIDDIRGMSAPTKLAGQLLAAGVLVLGGVQIFYFWLPGVGVLSLSGDLSAVITVLWTIAVI